MLCFHTLLPPPLKSALVDECYRTNNFITPVTSLSSHSLQLFCDLTNRLCFIIKVCHDEIISFYIGPASTIAFIGQSVSTIKEGNALCTSNQSSPSTTSGLEKAHSNYWACEMWHILPELLNLYQPKLESG